MEVNLLKIVNIRFDHYEDTPHYRCPLCQRETVITIKEAADLLEIDPTDINPEEDFSDNGQEETICQACGQAFSLAIEFDCAGEVDYLFQDRDHYHEYLSGDA